MTASRFEYAVYVHFKQIILIDLWSFQESECETEAARWVLGVGFDFLSVDGDAAFEEKYY